MINMSDNILVFGKGMEEHKVALMKVLYMLKDNNLTTNNDKCKFRKASVTYFGHRFLADGIRPTEEKVEVLVKLT